MKARSLNILLQPIKINTTVLDPAHFSFIYEYQYLENLTLRLFELNSKGLYQNMLADKVTENNDGTEFKIKIKDTYFFNGEKIVSQDIVNSFKRVILLGSAHTDPKNLFLDGEKLKNLSDDIRGLEVLSENELMIRLKRKNSEFFYFLQLVDFAILPKEFVEKDKILVSDWEKNSSGAYKLFYCEALERYTFKLNPRFLYGNPHSPLDIRPFSYSEFIAQITNVKDFNIEFGQLSYAIFRDYYDFFETHDQLNLYSQFTDNIVTLDLNIKSKKFSDQKVRQWIQKRIYLNFLKNRDIKHSQKATQYYLPGSKGYLKNSTIEMILKDININEIPKVLKDGITIKTFTTMEKHILRDIEQELNQSLGIPIKIEYTVKLQDYDQDINLKREHDAFLSANSMSYKVLTEALRLVYNPKSPTYLDPSGNIKFYMDEFLENGKLSSGKNNITRIISQMVVDSECVPLHYTATPIFYAKHIDVSEVCLDETLKLWKIGLNQKIL